MKNNVFNQVKIVVFSIMLSVSLVSFNCPTSEGFFANPDDVHSYYQCYAGVAYLRDCAFNMCWDQYIEACDDCVVISCDQTCKGRGQCWSINTNWKVGDPINERCVHVGYTWLNCNCST